MTITEVCVEHTLFLERLCHVVDVVSHSRFVWEKQRHHHQDNDDDDRDEDNIRHLPSGTSRL